MGTDTGATQGEGIIFLNLALVRAEGLYKASNRNTFYDDRKRLVALGFLEEITPRKEFYPRGERIKDVYALSGQWKNISEQEAEAIKKRMARKRKIVS